MSKAILIFFLISISLISKSQDLIVRNNGDNIACKVVKKDSVYVYFEHEFNNKKLESHLPIGAIKEIIYNMDSRNITQIPDSIKFIKKGGGIKYYHNDIEISGRQLGGLIGLNPAAYQEYKNYNQGKNFSSFLGFVGGFMVGWNISKLIRQEDPNWYVMGGGAGFIVFSIPISLGARSQLHKSIEIYNSGLNYSSSEEKEVIFGLNETGLGFKLKF
jgi:hypothetical protein